MEPQAVSRPVSDQHELIRPLSVSGDGDGAAAAISPVSARVRRQESLSIYPLFFSLAIEHTFYTTVGMPRPTSPRHPARLLGHETHALRSHEVGHAL